jgi:chromatin structure-remodeling complex protein RSC7
VVDDYYEDKVLEEITAQGLKPGDLVGDLQDPQATTDAAQLAAAEKQARNDRAGSGPGMYRAGGPTTIFGGPGWGPYSDGPLNAVRKSLLTRDGLNEENWMHIAAQRTMDASEEWTKTRKEALKICGGILGDGVIVSSPKRSGEDDPDGREEKRNRMDPDLPLGIYEPHSGIVLCESSVSNL